MNFVPMSILEYRFDDAGITQNILVELSTYVGNENFNVRVALDQDYLESHNPDLVLDTLNKEHIEHFARLKARDWVLVTRPEEPEVEE